MSTIRSSAGILARRLGLRRSPVAAIAPRQSDPAGATLSEPRANTTWTYPPADTYNELRLDVFRDLIALFGPGRYLDLGCGAGLFSVAAQELGWQATAVDARRERMLMTPGIEWVQHDVRSYDVSGYDVIGLLGLVYHLELPDQLDLLRRCSRTVTILDTHHSNRPNTTELGYSGHTFHELPDDQADRLAATPTAAWGNMTAFWPTEPDLVRMLTDCGYSRVLALVPPNLPDRTFYLCLPRRGLSPIDQPISGQEPSGQAPV
jgi:SAM-dependent methyltransferase